MRKLFLPNKFCAEALFENNITLQQIRLTGLSLLLFLSSFCVSAQIESGQDMEDTVEQTQNRSKREVIPFQKKGSFWQFSIGTLTGKNVYEEIDRMPSFNFMYSYKFNRSFSAGFGVGVDIMDYTAAPVFLDIKLHLPVNRSYSPYFYIKSGKSLSLSATTELYGMKRRPAGGFLIGAGAGIFLPGREDFRWFLQAGFRYNELNTEVTQSWLDRQSYLINTYSRMDVSFGVFFN